LASVQPEMPGASALTKVPIHVERRIRRRQPSDCGVVPTSTPVISFGALESASVATLGLNPSWHEFLDDGRAELAEKRRRLETLASLGTDRLEIASIDLVARVALACNRYFQTNPYRWFSQLEPFVRATGASYYNGSACHLDLVQWATFPVLGELRPAVRRRLLNEDVPFLAEQLTHAKLRLLLLNGKSVVAAFADAFQAHMEEIERVAATRIFLGELSGIRVVGWSTNIQSSFGVTNALRQAIAERLHELHLYLQLHAT
jgi:hypothetical protein